MQTSTAALFICCALISSYLRWRIGQDASLKGRETDHLVRGAARSAIQAKSPFVCQPESYKITSVSILKSTNNKWIHFKARLSPFTRLMTKAKGSSGSCHTEHKHSHWHYFIRPKCDFLCILQNTIAASIIWSIFAVEKQQWWSRYDQDYSWLR